MHTPLVSIIMPTYNWNHKRLADAIDSVLWQTYINYELIIINDASDNNIKQVIIPYVEKDERIKFIDNKERSKWIYTNILNQGLNLSTWKYIARQDDDDIWASKYKLEKQVKFMEENIDYWLVWTGVITIDTEWREIEMLPIRSIDQDIKKNLLQSSQFAHWSVLIRKSALDEVWYYDPRWNMVEDQELWLRIWLKYKLSNIPEYLFKYRLNPSWISISKFKKQRKLWNKLLFKYWKYYPNYLIAFIYRIIYGLLPYRLSKRLLYIKNKI